MRSTKKIWIINHHACGPGRHDNFSKQLSKLGNRVTLFASSFEHYTYKELKRYKNNDICIVENDNGYERIYIKTPKYFDNGVKRLINQIAFLIRVVKVGLKREKPDIIIGSSVHLFTGLAAYYLAKRFKVPFIFEVRDLWPQTLIDLGVLSEKSFITYTFKKIEKFLYIKSDKIISVLPNGVDYITSVGINKDKVMHIPNGVDLAWYDNCIEREPTNVKVKEYFLTADKYIFTYTGAHGLANGLDIILEAASLLQQRAINNIQILLVGDGPEKPRLIQKAKSLKLQNVTFLPKVEKDEIPGILNKSTACLSIVKRSKVHKFGISMNKLFDYMASRKPIVSVLDANFDFVDIANCGINIPPDNPEKIADALVKITDMTEDERKILGYNARRYVEKYHDYKVLGLKLNELLEQSLLEYSRRD